MKKRLVIALFLLILFTTFNSQQKFIISYFDLKTIEIENNLLLKDNDIKNLLISFYNKNLVLLNNNEVKKALMQNSLIESFKIKKKYPNTLTVKIFEKKPIAVLFDKKNKFYLSEKIDLIEFRNLPNYQTLPYVLGNKDDFKIFYNNLKKINFPLNEVKKYTLYETGRWDLETKDNQVIKLPSKNYLKNLKNFLDLKSKNDFGKYKLFDYRISKQLILR
jgi:cell division septal protein FtsQ